MDYEKYYDTRGDGSYIVHFPNGKGLNLTELKKIFSAFGTVLSVNNRGQTCGLCFVKYKHLDEVKRCIDGLRKHQFIKILPHINKKKPQSKQLKHNSLKEDSNSNFAATEHQKEQLKLNEKLGVWDDNDIRDGTISNTTGRLMMPLVERFKCSTIMEPRETSRSDSPSSSEATTDGQRKMKYVVGESEVPLLLSACEKYCIKNSKHFRTSEQIIPSQEIIVANIHPSLSVHYILHLLEKYNPISVSMMRKTAKAGIRYCHVYYRTYQEAYATIIKFDGHVLRGMGLIVMTPQKLSKEAF